MKDPKCIKLTLLDPTGVEVVTEKFCYHYGYGNRVLIEVNGKEHVINHLGEYLGIYDDNGMLSKSEPVPFEQVKAVMDIMKDIKEPRCTPHDDKFGNVFPDFLYETLETVCGHCGKKMTLVRPGKHQCDNPDCPTNQPTND